ncbi:uncharacterized protein C6orf203 homolog [Ceratina calcarata]|uniref:Uncharacterized protein C6orf203 homolog n=1 Tax=Ceratina calcarata TaxID=156304 RepID=A0AAJ7N5E0_9HYME|nr:uncharacterized protein C6orf203 homolog [Ceratina calcarata]
MISRRIFYIGRRTICTNMQLSFALENRSSNNSKCFYLNPSCPGQNLNLTFRRFKTKGKNTKQSREKDEDEEDEENNLDVDDYLNTEKSKVVMAKVPSLRLDAIAKAGFGLSRNKLEKEFYRSNIRLNGEKCMKKGIMISIGDEIDHIQGRSSTNANFLIINRCILLSVSLESEDEDIVVKLLQNKSLLVEDYKDKWHN